MRVRWCTWLCPVLPVFLAGACPWRVDAVAMPGELQITSFCAPDVTRPLDVGVDHNGGYFASCLAHAAPGAGDGDRRVSVAVGHWAEKPWPGSCRRPGPRKAGVSAATRKAGWAVLSSPGWRSRAGQDVGPWRARLRRDEMTVIQDPGRRGVTGQVRRPRNRDPRAAAAGPMVVLGPGAGLVRAAGHGCAGHVSGHGIAEHLAQDAGHGQEPPPGSGRRFRGIA